MWLPVSLSPFGQHGAILMLALACQAINEFEGLLTPHSAFMSGFASLLPSLASNITQALLACWFRCLWFLLSGGWPILHVFWGFLDMRRWFFAPLPYCCQLFSTADFASPQLHAPSSRGHKPLETLYSFDFFVCHCPGWLLWGQTLLMLQGWLFRIFYSNAHHPEKGVVNYCFVFSHFWS